MQWDARKNLEKYTSEASKTIPGPSQNPPKSSPERSGTPKNRPGWAGLAGLAAKGRTVIEGVSHIDRGYQKIEEKLGNIVIVHKIVKKIVEKIVKKIEQKM